MRTYEPLYHSKGKIKKFEKRRKYLEQLAKELEESNDKFDKATLAEKRVIIAQDAKKYIKQQLIIPANGITFDLRHYSEESHKLRPPELREYALNDYVNHCNACAKGGMFFSYIMRVNDWSRHNSVSNAPDANSMQKLNEIFSIAQLEAMEFFFEYKDYHGWYLEEGEEARLLYAYRRKVQERWDRLSSATIEKEYKNNYSNYLMVEICNNIIRHRGWFIPPGGTKEQFDFPEPQIEES